MKIVLLVSALAAVPARALPGAIDLDRAAGALAPEGMAPPAGFFAPAPPTPVAVAAYSAAPDDARVALAGLVDRHWTQTDWFDDAAGRTFVAGTLDLNGDGWLAVTAPGRAAFLVKIERGMSAAWSAGGRSYKLDLDVSIFRPRLSNVLEIRDAAAGGTVWRRRIVDLFQKTYDAGRAVVIGGRPYRLFLSRMPGSGSPASPSSRIGLCLIYDQLDGSGAHDQYDFYRYPLEALQGVALVVRLYAGDQALLQVSSDGEELTISR
jgi:uncharacterized protein YdeI (BOF family)